MEFLYWDNIDPFVTLYHHLMIYCLFQILDIFYNNFPDHTGKQLHFKLRNKYLTDTTVHIL